MLDVFVVMFKIIWAVVKIPVYVVGFWLLCFIVACFIQAAALRLSGKKFPRSELEERPVPVKRHGLLRSLFVDVPIRYVKDLYEREPGTFPYQGCIVFCGRQGAGKTIAAIEYIRYMRSQYPNCKVTTNCAYLYEDMPLYDWRPLVTYNNGIFGVVSFIDETQNWFSSNQSKNFPPEMLQVITQNRKNRRIILGTSQVFNRLSKPLREQATEVRNCITFFKCLTFVIRREPFLDSEGNVEKLKFRGIYHFVHDDDLRNSYDTYNVIESLAESGFQDRLSDPVVNNYLTVNAADQKKGRRK